MIGDHDSGFVWLFRHFNHKVSEIGPWYLRHLGHTWAMVLRARNPCGDTLVQPLLDIDSDPSESIETNH